MTRLPALTIALLLLGMTQVGCLQVNNAPLTSREAHVMTGVAYGTHPRQKIDIYRPAATPSTGDLIVFLYGGGWTSGEKDEYHFVARTLVEQGIVTVIPDYRTYPQSTFPTFVEDAALAVKWAHDHAEELGADPRRVFVMGHSAGGHLAALVTVDERYLRALELDKNVIAGTITLAGPNRMPYLIRSARPAFGVAMSQSSAPRQAEPATFVDGAEPPMLLIQGERDWRMPTINTTSMGDLIRSRGGRVRTIIYSNTGHTNVLTDIASDSPNRARVLDEVLDFMATVNQGRVAASR